MKRLLVSAIAVAGILLLVCEPALSASTMTGKFDPAQIEQGRVLAGIGNCETCHTVSADRPNAGGRPITTSFGTIFTSNITPDPEYGIGSWSLEAFIRAMREGISRDGTHLFPAFPYTHFALVTDDDLKSLYAYFMTRDPVQSEPPDNTLRFPFNVRALQAVWKLLFVCRPASPQVEGQSDAWNRGAYLAEGLGHCTACHSPRNAFGAERSNAAYEGAMADNWYAPALNVHHESPIVWSENEVYDYLRFGGSALLGVAVGGMAEVIHGGLRSASDADIHALATYLSDIGGDDGTDVSAEESFEELIITAHQKEADDMTRGGEIYASACASCHYNAPDHPNAMRPDLALNSSIMVADPINLIRMTLDGVSLEEGLPGVMMPGFDSLSDEDLVSLLRFLRRTLSRAGPWPNLEERVRNARHH